MAIKGGAPEGDVEDLGAGLYRAAYSNGNTHLPTNDRRYLVQVLDFGNNYKVLCAYSSQLNSSSGVVENNHYIGLVTDNNWRGWELIKTTKI